MMKCTAGTEHLLVVSNLQLNDKCISVQIVHSCPEIDLLTNIFFFIFLL